MTNARRLLPDEEVAYQYFKSELEDNTDYEGMAEDRAFDSFSAHLVLKPYSPTYNEIEEGVVDGPKDGGIDSLYALINERVLPNGALGDINPKYLSKRTYLDLYFIQSKNCTSWNATVWLKMCATLKMLLNSSLAEDDLRELHDSGLSDELQRFSLNLRETREKLNKVMPVIRLHCIYVSFGVTTKIGKLVRSRGGVLENVLKAMLPTDSIVTVEYWDCLRIKQVGSQSMNYKKTLQLYDQAIVENENSRDENEERGKAKNLVALVTLKDYIEFIRKSTDKTDKTDKTEETEETEETDRINEDMFESNVRDYAGYSGDVNKAILSTLKNDSSTHFWWLNNGITILADEAYDVNRMKWSIENPLIVNGLQTSFTIFNAYQENEITDQRLQDCLLVRVITSKDENIRQDIITGTNKQNSIRKTQLHANDSLQIRIEGYLKEHNWYYERRRYQYRSSTVPLNRIRTVTELSQAVMAFRLLEPDQARARPATFLNKDKGKGWDLVFPTKDEDLTLYLKALEVQNKVDVFLKKPETKKISSDYMNARYYLTSCYSLLSSGVKNKEDFKKITVNKLKDDPSDDDLKRLLKAFVHVSKSFDSSMQKNDQLYKNTDFRDKLFAEILGHKGTK